MSSSNDSEEGNWLSHILTDLSWDPAGISASDWNKVATQLRGLHSVTDCLAFCLSSERDLLSQWRGYASNGAGFAIGFNEDLFEGKLARILYEPDEQFAELARALAQRYPAMQNEVLATEHHGLSGGQRIAKLLEVGWMSHELLAIGIFDMMYTIKNDAFREEKEYRFIEMVDRLNLDAEYAVRGDRLVPYRIAPLSTAVPNPVTEVVLGPKNPTHPSVVHSLLKKYGYGDVRVVRSEASYR